MEDKSNKHIFSIIFLPLLFVIIIWCVKIIEYVFNFSLIHFGVLAKELSGIKGIIFYPFIHNDWNHLLNNTFPVFILLIMLFVFYRKIAIQIFSYLFLISGVLLWLIGRPDSYHIGASGIIFGLASFLITSGIVRKNPKLSSISLLVIFLYGSLIWGIFPFKINMSWEGHLSGFLTGILLAVFYRKKGPKRKKYSWEEEEEIVEEVNNSSINLLQRHN